MVIKKIYDGIVEHLEENYGVSILTETGNRISYVVYQAYLTSDKPIKVMKDLVSESLKLADSSTSYAAFQRSVYRELKQMFPNEPYINVVKLVYDIAKEIKI